MVLRRYTPNDCTALAELFYDTVHTINRKDYSEEQVCSWATGTVDLDRWSDSFLEHYTVVAEICNMIVGFGDIDKTGYLDRLYVHKDYQHQGIASAICDELEHAVNTSKITTQASITAKGFFEKRGYKVVKEQKVECHSVLLTNYIMER